MYAYILLMASAAFLIALFAWRVYQLKKLHSTRASIDPAPEILGPKEVHRHRL